MIRRTFNRFHSERAGLSNELNYWIYFQVYSLPGPGHERFHFAFINSPTEYTEKRG